MKTVLGTVLKRAVKMTAHGGEKKVKRREGGGGGGGGADEQQASVSITTVPSPTAANFLLC